MRRRLAIFMCLAFFQGIFQIENSAQTADSNLQSVNVKQGAVTIDSAKPIKIFDPHRDLGAGIDGHDFGEINKQLTPKNIRQMLAVGFKPLTYRLRTELGIEAWHWNPRGRWSDKAAREGYWTSAAHSNGDISLCYGYRLPRRGNTIDQANNKGYSRLDDGDPRSFWKSNPYLDKHFTNEENSLHEQWIVIDFGEEKDINAVKVLWGTPFAVEYEVQYGEVADISDISQNPPELWKTFQNGKVETKEGGEIQTKLADETVKTRYVRLLLKQSSNTSPKKSKDIRDSLGFAVRELYFGSLDDENHFKDEIKHGARAKLQTAIYVSSTDPWHRAADLDRDTEQAGFDRIYKDGLTNNLPMLTPVGLLYDTPDNAAAEISYLIKKGYNLNRVELGEEPDGQYVTPEDFGTLYLQFADAIHKIAPQMQLGGPSFQEISTDKRGFKTELFNPVWLERFMNYLEKRHRSRDFSFFSFEWYPFDDVCEQTAPQLAEMPYLMSDYIAAFYRHGLKPDIPLVITEYGYSAFSTQAEDDIEGALLNADSVGKFLTLGGSEAYLYGYEPNQVERDEKCTAGNNMMLIRDANGKIKYKTATYYGAALMMHEWLQPAGGEHKLYLASSNIENDRGQKTVDAYAVLRPDQKWALMLINKDPQNEARIKIRFAETARQIETSLMGKLDFYQFSGRQFTWNAKLARPAQSAPPEHKVIDTSQTPDFELPPYSLTILREH